MTENHNIGKQNDDGIKRHTFLAAFNYKVPTIFFAISIIRLNYTFLFLN